MFLPLLTSDESRIALSENNEGFIMHWLHFQNKAKIRIIWEALLLEIKLGHPTERLRGGVIDVNLPFKVPKGK